MVFFPGLSTKVNKVTFLSLFPSLRSCACGVFSAKPVSVARQEETALNQRSKTDPSSNPSTTLISPARKDSYTTTDPVSVSELSALRNWFLSNFRLMSLADGPAAVPRRTPCALGANPFSGCTRRLQPLDSFLSPWVKSLGWNRGKERKKKATTFTQHQVIKQNRIMVRNNRSKQLTSGVKDSNKVKGPLVQP